MNPESRSISFSPLWIVAGAAVLAFGAFLYASTPLQFWIYTLVLYAVFLLVIFLARKPLQRHRVKHEAENARLTFRLGRELLEAKFFTLASSLGKPRGLKWLDCDWHDDVILARDRQTGLITAFVGVSLRFEAIEGSDMEDVAAVSSLRDASALFHYQAGNWGTGGRALFNMDPQTAIERLQDQYESLEPKVGVSARQ